VSDFQDLIGRTTRLLERARRRGLRIATAESCTGGLVAATLTEIAGSSDVFDRGFVTYSNEAKTAMLGVPMTLIAAHGAVSEPVARAMAEGALVHSAADVAVSVTGVAGPGGGSAEKPVGLVHFALAVAGAPTGHAECRFGNVGRAGVRAAAVLQALSMLETALADGESITGRRPT
jgi:competence/damage-inducible protein CinA C-terminal domain